MKTRQTKYRLHYDVAALLLALVLAPAAWAQEEGEEPVQETGEVASEAPVEDAPVEVEADLESEPEPEAPVFVDALESDGERRTVTECRIEFTNEAVAGRPESDEILNTWMTLSRAEDGWVAPRPDGPTELVNLLELPDMPAADQTFYDSALALISPAVVQRLQALGYIGVYVEPDPDAFRVVDGLVVDSRGAGDTGVTLQITMGVVVDVRTNALGARIKEPPTLNHPAHDRIRRGSPVRAHDPDVELDDDQTALLRRDMIDRYTQFLTRHPGRRVDVAVVPEGSQFGGVSLDYLVTENKPWAAFFQVGNTGSDNTEEIQQRFGFVHNQVTNNDDIFLIDYLTGSFGGTNAVTSAYERPVSQDGRLRGRVFGSWYEYESSDLGQSIVDYDGEGYTAGLELRWNFYQDRDLFLDLIGGLRWERAETSSDAIIDDGDEDFLVPSIGVRLEQYRRARSTSAGIAFEGNIANVDGAELTALGRFDPDKEWIALLYDASHTFYVEPLLAGDKDEPTALAHEIALLSRGQYAFDNRLVPTFQRIAGGLFTVRGYPQAVVAGDSVFIGTAEYRFHIPQGLATRAQPARFFGTPFRAAPQYVSGPTDWDLILKGFVDAGRVLQSDRYSFESHDTLVGAGVGLEAVIQSRLRVQTDFAWALRAVDELSGVEDVDYGDFEFHFFVTVIF